MKNTLLVAIQVSAFYAALQFLGGKESLGLFVALFLLISSVVVSVADYPRQQADKIVISPISGVLIIYFLWIAISIPFSISAGTSFQVGAYLVSLPLTYLALACCSNNEKIWEESFFLIKVMAAVVMGLAILEFAVWRDRPTSVFVDTNVLAAFCNAMTLPAISLAFRRKIEGRPWTQVLLSGNGLFILAGLTVLVITSSRAGLISFVLSYAALTLILARQSRQAYALAGVVIVGYIALSPLNHLLPQGVGLTSRLRSLSNDQSISDRIEMLRSAWTVYLNHPFFGIGLGTFKLIYPAVRSTQEISSGGELLHSDYAQFLLEGGPGFAGLLVALAALSIWRVWGLWRRPASLIESRSHAEAAGLSCGLVGLFIHAAPNFIFYVPALSILAGSYLARLETLAPLLSGRLKIKPVPQQLSLRLAVVALVFVVATLGLQAGFIELTAGRCELQICKRLSVRNDVLARYASLLASTQPSYFPARTWLIAGYIESAEEAADGNLSVERARLAVSELADILSRTPVLEYPYRQLGELIQKYPLAANVLPPALPHDPKELFRAAIARDPLDTAARLELASLLEQRGEPEQAFSLIFDDGMRWWKVELLPDSGRFDMLRYAMPLASKLGRCKDALDMAHGLLVFEADNSAAKSIIEKSADFENDHLGSACEKQSATPAA